MSKKSSFVFWLCIAIIITFLVLGIISEERTGSPYSLLVHSGMGLFIAWLINELFGDQS